MLVTGTAGFIGSHLIQRLLTENMELVGLDSINDYYDVRIKEGRLERAGIAVQELSYGKLVQSSKHANYRFVQMNLADKEGISQLFAQEQFTHVVNLAAQAGVRYSISHPHVYTESNVTGFLNILEGCRYAKTAHLVYASTSSVYGLNTNMPLSPHESTEHPMTLYAATKKANELMAHSYSHLFGMATTGVRFFTVYGPWGRPDMALFLFADAIVKGEPIKVFNNGEMIRDFTYVTDITEGLYRLLIKAPVANADWNSKTPDPANSSAPYRIVNIGNSNPVKLMDYIGALEKALGRTALKEMLPMQLGDVPATHADMSDLVNDYGYKPETNIIDGVQRFVDWYSDFYKIKKP